VTKRRLAWNPIAGELSRRREREGVLANGQLMTSNALHGMRQKGWTDERIGLALGEEPECYTTAMAQAKMI